MRGPLAPSHVPIAKSRGERFDDFVLEAVERLKPRLGSRLAAVEFAVEEVPPARELNDGPGLLGIGPIPFGRAEPASGRRPAVVIIYRRPLEARARDRDQLGALIHDTVVEQIAGLLGLSPDSVDPGYDDPD